MRGEPATDQEEEELERGMRGISRALYEDSKTSDSLMAMATAETPEGVVGGAARAVITLVTELDKKLDLEKTTIPELTAHAADRLVDLLKESGVEVSDQETRQIVMTAEEGILKAYGMSEEESAELVSGMSDQEYSSAKNLYSQTLGDAGNGQS